MGTGLLTASAITGNMTGMSKKKLSFEEAIAKLTVIADEIENGEIGLEESITKYEEGMNLLSQCQEILTSAEQRIIKLRPDPDAKRPGKGT